MSRSRASCGTRVARCAVCACMVVALAVLAGCGFHLQGSYAPPPGVDSVYVAYHNAYRPGQPPLVDYLQQRLRMLDLLGGRGADARLIVKRVTTSRTGVSVSPLDGDTVEYSLTISVLFDYIANNRPLLTGETFSLTRYYSYNETARLAAQTERRELSADMQRQLVNRILFRIKNVTPKDSSKQM